MIVEHGTWVITADGGGASVFRNTGRNGQVKLKLSETHDPHNSAFKRDIGAAKSGRYPLNDSGKSTSAEPDIRDKAEHGFALRLASHIDILAGTSPTAPWVLFASPRFLGLIRPFYTIRMKRTLAGEAPTDMRRASVAKLEQALVDLVAD